MSLIGRLLYRILSVQGRPEVSKSGAYLCKADAVLLGGHVFVPRVVVVGFHNDLLLARLDRQDLILEGCKVGKCQEL